MTSVQNLKDEFHQAGCSPESNSSNPCTENKSDTKGTFLHVQCLLAEPQLPALVMSPKAYIRRYTYSNACELVVSIVWIYQTMHSRCCHSDRVSLLHFSNKQHRINELNTFVFRLVGTVQVSPSSPTLCLVPDVSRVLVSIYKVEKCFKKPGGEYQYIIRITLFTLVILVTMVFWTLTQWSSGRVQATLRQ